ncbi:MAG TPA: FKBP-type peptidyl-prolyl cis-trans isomerase [Fimbriimonadales bacterium]|nr:FKBP-type peptidyl-prolyl cis-trans isomerase [Fimbriimonadales bacterium]
MLLFPRLAALSYLMPIFMLLLLLGLSSCTPPRKTEEIAEDLAKELANRRTPQARLRPFIPPRIKITPSPKERNLDKIREASAQIKTLQVKDVILGSGKIATEDSTVFINYVGRLPDGTIFDSNLLQSKPALRFTIGKGTVVKGLEMGVSGMRVGGVRTITIPPQLGYGNKPPVGSGIPPNAALIFDVELVFVAEPEGA